MFTGLLQPGDAFHHRQPGGGGHGDPFERDPDAVARDVADGKVTRGAASSLYGVVVDDAGVDYGATAVARSGGPKR